MRMYDLIEKKKTGKRLSEQEINWIVEGFTDGTIPDYQMSALLMAIYFVGMDDDEMTWLTMAMAHSGDMLDLSKINGIKADKHSTGGVGDKTTLIVIPVVAACGVKVAKMSGRGLGHTGGTIDKLESIPGFRTTLSKEEFFDNVNKHGLCVIGQSGNITPADKKIYAMRDVTATVDSIPLIASSIMSKKLAAGSDCILLDVKTGSGAFMQTVDDSKKLAKKMVAIGKKAGRKTAALITNMDIPLGYGIGNSIEVIEAVDTLKGRGPKDLYEVCVELAACMLKLSGIADDIAYARDMAKGAISSGKAYDKLKEMVKAQGGDTAYLDDTSLFDRTQYSYEVKADKSGYIQRMNTQDIGIASMILGAGRQTKEDTIDMAAGIILKKKTSDEVKEGETLAVLYSNDSNSFSQAEDIITGAYTINEDSPKAESLIIDLIE